MSRLFSYRKSIGFVNFCEEQRAGYVYIWNSRSLLVDISEDQKRWELENKSSASIFGVNLTPEVVDGKR